MVRSILQKNPLSGNSGVHVATPCTRREKIVVALLFLAVLVLRLVYIFRYRVDSDEPQHLFVVWQWSQGLVAYRDFFDNHAPLFPILMTPVLNWLGERADILDHARVFMVPFFLLSLGAVHWLGRVLFSERVGLWAPIIAGALPNYFFPTIEFRPDNLWAAVWLLALAVLISGRPSLPRSFIAGLLAGISLSASIKTGLLIGALAGAAGVAFLVAPAIWREFKPARFLAHIASALAGFVVVPGMLVVFLARQGALADMKYCIFQHNILPAGMHVEGRTPSWILLALAVLILTLIARILFRFWGNEGTAFRRTTVFLHAGLLLSVLELAWPVNTRQNYLPVYPLAMLILCVPLISAAERISSRSRISPESFLACLVVAMLGWVMLARPITINQTLPVDHLIAEALTLTRPNEYIMTHKGEAVFRPRPYYFVLEPFTRARLNNGLLPDEISDRLIATRTCVAMTITHRLPRGARHFIEDNYIPVGQLRVVGKKLPAPDREGNIRFTIKIPADYTLVMDGGEGIIVQLDGKPFSKSAFMEAGDHVLRIPGQEPAGTLLWTRAVQHGFKPLPQDYQPEKIGSEF